CGVVRGLVFGRERTREANLRGQVNALDAQAAGREAYFKLADDLEGFLTQLHGSADTAAVGERQRVLRLLVKDILIGPGKITIRHRTPARSDGPATRQYHAETDTEGDQRASCPLRWGRGFTRHVQRLLAPARPGVGRRRRGPGAMCCPRPDPGTDPPAGPPGPGEGVRPDGE